MVFNGVGFTKTHIIEDLSKKAYKVDPSLEKILKPARDFTDYAVAYRYPDAAPQKDELTEEEVRAAVKIAEGIYQELRNRIPIS